MENLYDAFNLKTLSGGVGLAPKKYTLIVVMFSKIVVYIYISLYHTKSTMVGPVFWSLLVDPPGVVLCVISVKFPQN